MTATATTFPNRYAGTCVRCNNRVDAGAGLCSRGDDRRWVVRHQDGTCPPAVAPTPRPARAPMPDVPGGYYALKSRTGTNDLDFFRVDRPTEGRWTGYTFVKRVIGGHADTPVRGVEARGALERILAAGPDHAALLYALSLGRCSCCNRHLTDEVSRQYGMGPDCRAMRAVA
jgi:hypothetical protein